ncbi:MAG: hypothetical protein IPK68_19395 [Bdellovibrionales bacterium]|nr:hypothetical protein [Bdellovibrionales bacterium]
MFAAIITSKYCDGLPLYRIEEIMERQELIFPAARWPAGWCKWRRLSCLSGMFFQTG